MKERMSTIILAALLLVLSAVSLFVGVIDVTPIELFRGNMEQLEIFLISRLPRLLAIICTGVGMSTAGLIMQQLCMNKFVSPTTGATISSAQFGILLALLFMPQSTLWGGQYLHLPRRFSEHGFLCGSYNEFSLKKRLWYRLWELCSGMWCLELRVISPTNMR